MDFFSMPVSYQVSHSWVDFSTCSASYSLESNISNDATGSGRLFEINVFLRQSRVTFNGFSWNVRSAWTSWDCANLVKENNRPRLDVTPKTPRKMY